jgi:DNA repair protein RadD
MELRSYQKEAVAAIARDIPVPGNSIVSLPTGSGKSIVIAEIASRLGPVLIMQPSAEILLQNKEKLARYVPSDDIGVYSASMNEKNVKKFTLATIGSVYTKPELFAHYRFAIIDECHLVPVKSLESMFMTFLTRAKIGKIIGLTATPWRMDTQWKDWGTPVAYEYATTKILTRMKHKSAVRPFWNRIIYHTDIGTLIKDGYLSPLEYFHNSKIRHENIPTNKSRSDFDLDAYQRLISAEEDAIIDAIHRLSTSSRSTLVFCSSVEQAERMGMVMKKSRVVTARTSIRDRREIVDEFKGGNIPLVFNVGVFTTGFDHPALDAIALLRPTRSIGLYYQMLGRGVRKADGKTSCRVVDFSGTVRALGRIETIRLVKTHHWELWSEKGQWHGRELYPIMKPIYGFKYFTR